MLTKPQHGWTHFESNGRHLGRVSDISDVPMILLDALLEYFSPNNKCALNVVMDAEGWDVGFVEVGEDFFFFDTATNSDIPNFISLSKNTPYFAKECIANFAKEIADDIERDLDDWAAFSVLEIEEDEQEKETKERKVQLQQKVAALKSLISAREKLNRERSGSMETADRALYKAKGRDGEGWQTGYYWFCQDTLLCIASEAERKKNEHHYLLFSGCCDWGLPMPHYKMDIVPETLCQYTGRQDTKHKRIFEHDLCKSEAENALVEIVWHNSGWYGLYVGKEDCIDKEKYRPLDSWFYQNGSCSLTIVGNSIDGTEEMRKVGS